MSFWTWHEEGGPARCAGCRVQGRACESCQHKPPELKEDNEEAWELWLFCQAQWRLGPLGGLIGLDLVAVKVAAEALDITLDRMMLRKLILLENKARPALSDTKDNSISAYCRTCREAKRNQDCSCCVGAGKAK
ncbi:MAG: DUF1799 domain-containing protein [Thermodesulfobacteriota bacterium]